MTEKTVSVSYTTRFLVNNPTGWRQKLAQVLIGVAARLDRQRWMLAVEFRGTAAVGRKVEREIVCSGLDMMQAAFDESVANETLEGVMRDEYPYLYQNHVGSEMLKCSHGLDLECRCQQCTQEALTKPSCWTTYWIAGRACTKPADVSKRCVGCAYYVEGVRS